MVHLALDNLSAGYPRRPVLHGLSAQLSAGSVTAVIGANGAGKTTLLRTLIGLIPASAGTALWHADTGTADLLRLRPRDRARYVAYIPQVADNALPMAVRDSLWIAAGGRNDGETGQRLTALAAELDLDLHARCDTLSGGVWRRVLIAQGLAQGAPILLCDEPTAFLDPPSRHDVLGLLRELSRSQGLCVLCVLHEPELALEYADQVLALADGRIAASGQPSTLTPEVLTAVYGGPDRNAQGAAV